MLVKKANRLHQIFSLIRSHALSILRTANDTREENSLLTGRDPELSQTEGWCSSVCLKSLGEKGERRKEEERNGTDAGCGEERKRSADVIESRIQ